MRAVRWGVVMLSMTMTLMAMLSSAQAATVYRHVDAQGNVSYSDSPQQGEAVELEPLTVVPASRGLASPQRAASASAAGSGPPAPPFLPYSTFRIASPQNEQTLPTGYAGNVQVEVSIEPTLREDHRVRLLLDGRLSQSALHSDVFMLTNLDRGEHQLVAELLDTDGRVRHRSEPVTLFVQRASVNLPRNPQ